MKAAPPTVAGTSFEARRRPRGDRDEHHDHDTDHETDYDTDIAELPRRLSDDWRPYFPGR
jgi:hypothetical protein